jgi:predicted regulator of Ras-like GTPase activity (Roadblock/LC7/MglB family)
MLEETLERAAGVVEGIRGIWLIGMDGVPVAGCGDPGDFPVEFIHASYADLLKKAGNANREAELEPPAELMVTGSDMRLVMRAVTPEYGLVAVLAPDGNLGRMRYELLKASLDLEPELG